MGRSPADDAQNGHSPHPVPVTAARFPRQCDNNYAEIGKFDDSWRCIDEALTAVEALSGVLPQPTAVQIRWWIGSTSSHAPNMRLDSIPVASLGSLDRQA
jgi:hypothetical protein